MSGADSGALVHALPSLRSKLPAAPDAVNPVPPRATGTIPSEMCGVVVGVATRSGLSAVTLVTPPFAVSVGDSTISRRGS